MEQFEIEKNICNVLSSGSHGNAVIYHQTILLDIGVPYKTIEPYKNQLQVVLLTHEHSDHINIKALKKLCFERPGLRVACGYWMQEKLEGLRNVDILEAGKVYDYGNFKISPIVLYHDVLTFGFRIFKGDHKTIHITDTAHVIGITAKDYDLFAVESNYCEEGILQSIAAKEAKGEFAYQKNSINSHLSQQQAKEFIFKNKGPHSKIVRLHESRNS